MKMKVVKRPFGSRYGLEEAEAVFRVLKNAPVNGMTLGPELQAFEREFAEYTGAKEVVAVDSATAALHLATVIFGIGEGDEVIANALTFPGTPLHPLKFGARVRFADVNSETLNVDEDKIEPLINEKTRAIYVASYEGGVPDMERIMDIARRHRIYFLFDAARCMGGKFRGRDVGSIPHVGVFSFHNEKNMVTGEGGALSFNYEMSEEWASKARALRSVTGTGELIGEMFRLDEIHSAIARAQLKKIDTMNDERRKIAHFITEKTGKIEGIYPVKEFSDRKHVFHWYMARLDSKKLGIKLEDFVRVLEKEEGVQVPEHNMPIYLYKPYQIRGYKRGYCPVAEKLWYEQNFHLPLNLGMSMEEIEVMVGAIRRTIEQLRK